MEVRLISTLRTNPNNHRDITATNNDRLKKQLTMGPHETFLITPDGMVVDGNHRLEDAAEAGWNEVPCQILDHGQDEQGIFAILDGKEYKTIHYSSLDQMYKAFQYSRNGHFAQDNKEQFINDFQSLDLDPTMFDATFFEPKNVQDDLKRILEHEEKKKYQIIIECLGPEDLNEKYQQIQNLGIQAKKKE